MLDFFKNRLFGLYDEVPIYIKSSPDIPVYCRVCGGCLIWVIEPNGYWEDNGEKRVKIWLKCPNWAGGQTKYIDGATITYTALELNRERTDFVPRFGYTRYQTCDNTIIY